MSKYIIIKGKVNSGKTTTCALLYDKLKKVAEKSFLFTSPLNRKIDKIEKNNKGNLKDFVSIHIFKGKVIVIISAGDEPKPLVLKIQKLLNPDTVIELTGEPYEVDIFVVCSRTQMRENSTLEMLYNRIPVKDRIEFETKYSENPEQKKTVKRKIVNNIIEHISREAI